MLRLGGEGGMYLCCKEGGEQGRVWSVGSGSVSVVCVTQCGFMNTNGIYMFFSWSGVVGEICQLCTSMVLVCMP